MEKNINAREEQSKKILIIWMLIQNNANISKLAREDYELIKNEIEHSKNSNGEIDINKLKHIREYLKAKISYTDSDIYQSNLYVQIG